MLNKLTLVCLVLVSISYCLASYEDRERRSIFNKCISDHECKPMEFCDHSGINPLGSCKVGKELKSTCVFDRHCKSKVCHHMKCVNKKPVKDGPCNPHEHAECLPTQYCSSKNSSKDLHKCRDRKCTGMCTKDAHCISNKCTFFSCKKNETACAH